MENYLKETLKDLINLRTSLMTIIVVITTGLLGLLFTSISFEKFITLLLIGIYFDSMFLMNVLNINKEIKETTGRFLNVK